MMLLVHDQGVNARVDGLPRRPPSGYDVAIGLDLVEIWTVGWDAADRQLAPSVRVDSWLDCDRAQGTRGDAWRASRR